LATLGRLLEDMASDQVEVIVTDDGRLRPVTDDDLQDLPWVKRIVGPAKGPAANRNFGAAMASGEVLLFLDDDCIPEANYLKSFFDFWRESDPASLTISYGPTIPLGPMESLLFEAPDNTDGQALISSNFSIGKTSLSQVGGFDGRYPSAAFEDTEFFERFGRLGGKTIFLRSAAVSHPYRRLRNPKNLAKKWEAKVIFALDQGATPFSLYYRVPWHVLRVIVSRFRGKKASRRNFQAAALFACEWLWTLILCPVWISKWMHRERSEFWVMQRSSGPAVPRHGL
jgi:GT2 family glycosyltransferase